MAARPPSSAAQGTAPATPAPAATPSTFAHQTTLPRLPVPPLPVSIARYLRSARPLASDDEYKTLVTAAKELLTSGLGAVLQGRLEARAADYSHSSWLIDWWNSLAYMTWRLPVVINVSYFYQFKDDATRCTQTSRAASLISAAMAFRDLVVHERLPAERSGRGDGKLCMQMYKYLFNSARIPRPEEDTHIVYPKSNTKVLVIRKNRFFLLEVGEQDARASVEQIEAGLQAILTAAGTTKGPAVGALTASDRDVLAVSYQALLDASPINVDSVSEIQGAVFAVCLDDTSPTDPTEVARTYLHGDGANRWYDKTCEFIVHENGKAGFLGEHSMSDGMPTANMVNWMLDGIANKRLAVAGAATSVKAAPEPTELPFVINAAVAKHIREAEVAFAQLIADHEVGTLVFSDYGKDKIKDMKCSPDAWAQLAIQLTYYSMFGECRATYEPAHTRQFLYGRTECIRTVSCESVAFVKAMRSPAASAQEKAAKLQAAGRAHVEYSAAAANGMGVDRHMLGLRLMRKPSENSAFFNHPVFKRTCHWSISTSNLSSEYIANWGWGEVVPDGFGVAYSTLNDKLIFNITSRTGVGAKQFARVLNKCLLEMREISLAAAAAQPQSKL